jgi:hypothetical protein
MADPEDDNEGDAKPLDPSVPSSPHALGAEAGLLAIAPLLDSSGQPILDKDGAPIEVTYLPPPVGHSVFAEGVPPPYDFGSDVAAPAGTVELAGHTRVSTTGGANPAAESEPTGGATMAFGGIRFTGGAEARVPGDIYVDDPVQDDIPQAPESDSTHFYNVSITESASAADGVDAEVVRHDAPEVPPARFAAIEPEWIDGRLTLPAEAARANLPADQVSAMLGSFVGELLAFIAEVEATNADDRFVRYLRQLADTLPISSPDQLSIFRLGHAVDLLEAYTSTIEEETTSRFLVHRYTVMVSSFRQATAQFPAWREFKRNALADELSADQVAKAPQLAHAFASIIASDRELSFIDPAIPNALIELAGGGEHPAAVATAGGDMRAADIVGSISNILKALAGAVAGWGKPTADAVGRGALKGVEKIGENVVVGATNLMYAGAVTAITALYPNEFTWLVVFLAFASHIANALKK